MPDEDIETRFRTKRAEDRVLKGKAGKAMSSKAIATGGGDAQEDEVEVTQNVSDKGSGYEKEYRDWFLPLYGDKFNKSFEFFKLTKESHHKLERANLWDWLTQYSSGHVEYLDDNFDSRTIIGLISHAFTTLREDRFYPIIKHIIKFVLPTNDGVPRLLLHLSDTSKVLQAICFFGFLARCLCCGHRHSAMKALVVLAIEHIAV